MGKGSSKPFSSKDIEDLKRRTNFSASEIKQWYEKFKTDFAEDGVVTRESFLKVYPELIPGGTQFSEHVFSKYDTNQNGEIEFDEFITILSIIRKGTLQEKLGWAFDLYDLNSNGFITKQEGVTVIEALYETRGVPDSHIKAGTTVMDLFQRMDADGDGQISRDEFVDTAMASPELQQLFV